MNRFDLCQKQSFASGTDFNESDGWDLFISGFNLSERVRYVYDQVNSRQKIWLVAPDYGLENNEFPPELHVYTQSRDEGAVVRELFRSFEFQPEMNVCIDSTGFVRQHLLVLLRILYERGLRKFHVLYAEPETYREKERTQFSGGAMTEVRHVMGYEGEVREGGHDLLIIGSGYDDRMIAKVAENKSSCKIIQMFGFPALRPDMYQENLLRVSKAESYTDKTESIFAPANDPFVTASVLKETVVRKDQVSEIGNLYLSPLGQKAQVLGFALYYIAEKLGKSTNIIYPMSDSYSKDTTVGVSKIWKYSVEL